jgi:hypothetical protein
MKGHCQTPSWNPIRHYTLSDRLYQIIGGIIVWSLHSQLLAPSVKARILTRKDSVDILKSKTSSYYIGQRMLSELISDTPDLASHSKPTAKWACSRVHIRYAGMSRGMPNAGLSSFKDLHGTLLGTRFVEK